MARLLPLMGLAAGASAASPWTLHLLDQSKFPMAACLDGSAPGYYFSPGWGNGSSSWVIHTQGGGWCVSDADCAGRAKSALGSSSSWAASGCDSSTDKTAPVCYADGGFNGMISNSSSENPLLYNWNKVFIAYCDGASYASARAEPITVGSQTLFYRGYYNLQNTYDELFASHGLGSAANVVIKGCSAGGLAVYLHIDQLRARINAVNPATRVLGAPGAGFFLGEAAAFSPPSPRYLANYQWVFANGNMSSSLNAACMAAKAATNDTWRCFLAPEVLPYIETPLFISNSLSDAWQSGNIMNLGCAPTKAGACSEAQMAYLQGFRAQMLALLQPATKPGSPHGGFLQGCFVHVVEDTGGWGGVLIGGQTQAQVFSEWFAGGGSAALAVGTFPPWSNPTC